MHHLPDDRSGADDRHLDDEIVEALRPHARQGRHLRAALDLEDADGVGGAQHAVGRGIVGRQVREVERDALVLAYQRDGLLEHRHHAEAEQVDLDDAEIGAVVLVPLHDDAPGHRGGLERHHLVEPAGGDHHAAGVLAEVARQVLDLLRPDRPAARRAATRGRRRRCAAAPRARRGRRDQPMRAQQLGEPVDLRKREAEHLADLAHGAARAVGDDVGGHRRAALAVALVDVLDDLLALVAARQVDVDVGPLAALLGEEALEEQLHADGVDGGDAERVADRRVGGRAAALAEDAALARRSARCPRR